MIEFLIVFCALCFSFSFALLVYLVLGWIVDCWRERGGEREAPPRRASV